MNGRTHPSNKTYLDHELGTLVRWSMGGGVIENMKYSSFGGIWPPAHIGHTIDGKLRVEIDQKISVIDGPID